MNYTSTGQSPFDSWRIWLFATPFMIGLFFYLPQFSIIPRPVFGMLLPLFIVIAITVLRISVVEIVGGKLRCYDIRKKVTLQDIKEIETWWSYDFGSSSIVLEGGGTAGNSRAMSNNIMLFIRIYSQENSVVIYEKLQWSDNVPTKYPYKWDVNLENVKKFKVWSINDVMIELRLFDYPNINESCKKE